MQSVFTSYVTSLHWLQDVFTRPNWWSGDYFYGRFILSTQTSGTYLIRTNGSLNTYGYLYTAAFDKTSPSASLIAQNDDSAGDGQFRISSELVAGQTYEVIVTTASPDVSGSYTLLVFGPTAVNLTYIPPPTLALAD